MKINIKGDVFTNDGYASHTVQLARGLKQIGFDIGLETNCPDNWQAIVNDDLREMIDKPYDDETTIMISLPISWTAKLSQRPKKFYGFFVWESEDIPRCFLEVMDDKRIDGIFVPSSFLKVALERAEVKTPIYVVPHGVDQALFHPMEIEERDQKFTFLFHKGWAAGKNDRSGFEILLQAFTEEFNKSEEVCLVAKIVATYNPPGWNLQNEISKLGLNFENSPEIKIVQDFVNIKELYKFYNSGDVFVLPSKGEGFGLTAIEAMACKVPVIATAATGHLDFVNNDNGWLVDYVPTIATGNYMTEWCTWYTPTLKDLRKKMREAFESWKTDDFEIKRRLAFETSQKFSWVASAKKVEEIVKE